MTYLEIADAVVQSGSNNSGMDSIAQDVVAAFILELLSKIFGEHNLAGFGYTVGVFWRMEVPVQTKRSL